MEVQSFTSFCRDDIDFITLDIAAHRCGVQGPGTCKSLVIDSYDYIVTTI